MAKFRFAGRTVFSGYRNNDEANRRHSPPTAGSAPATSGISDGTFPYVTGRIKE